MTSPASLRDLCATSASFVLCSLLLLSLTLPAQTPKSTGLISGVATYALTKQFLAVAPKRFNGSPGHLAAENFIQSHFAFFNN